MSEKKPDIKIFVSHRIDQDSETIDNPLYLNVRCGAVYDTREDVSMLGDDTGDNISNKVNTFGDLTVQYWAWKNVEADYYGFYKANQYLLLHSDLKNNFDKTPNCLNVLFSEDNIKKYRLNLAESSKEIISKYNAIVGKPKEKKDTSFFSSFMSKLDGFCIETYIETIRSIQPDFGESAKKYNESEWEFETPLFIMDKSTFFELCEFQFSVLFELEKSLNVSKLTTNQLNIFEVFGAFLFGTFIYSKRSTYRLKISNAYYLIFNFSNMYNSFHPAFNYNNIPIILSSSDFFSPYLGVCITSIINSSNSENNYDIIVFERDMTTLNKHRILSLVQGKNNISIRFFNVAEQIKDANFFINSDRISQETYYGLLVAWFLPYYKKAIIMDCDMVVKRDLSDLYGVSLEDKIGGGVNDVILQGWLNDPNNDTYEYYVKDLHIINPFLCFNGGLILLDLEKFRNTFTREKIMNYIININ